MFEYITHKRYRIFEYIIHNNQSFGNVWCRLMTNECAKSVWSKSIINISVFVPAACPPNLSAQSGQTLRSSHPSPAVAGTAPAVSRPGGQVTGEGPHGSSHKSDERTSVGKRSRGHLVGHCQRWPPVLWDTWGWHEEGQIGYVGLHSARCAVPRVPQSPEDCNLARSNVGARRPRGNYQDYEVSRAWDLIVTWSLWEVFSPDNVETQFLNENYPRDSFHHQLLLCLGNVSLNVWIHI